MEGRGATVKTVATRVEAAPVATGRLVAMAVLHRSEKVSVAPAVRAALVEMAEPAAAVVAVELVATVVQAAPSI